MMELTAFKAEHYAYMWENGFHDKKLYDILPKDMGAALEKRPMVITLLDKGKPVVFGSVNCFWENRGEAWLIFGKTRPESFLTIFRHLKYFLSQCTVRRIEIVVDYKSKNPVRLAEMLGFKKEADRLEKYYPNGEDASLYVLIKEGIAK